MTHERLTAVDLHNCVAQYTPIHGPAILFEVTSIYNSLRDLNTIDRKSIRAFLASPRFAELTIEHVPISPNPDMFIIIAEQPITGRIYTIDGPLLNW